MNTTDKERITNFLKVIFGIEPIDKYVDVENTADTYEQNPNN